MGGCGEREPEVRTRLGRYALKYWVARKKFGLSHVYIFICN